MTTSSESVKEALLRENEEFQRLAQKHRELEDRLSSLSQKLLLSDDEKYEEVTLKKKKLVLKDKMADLIRQRESTDGARPKRVPDARSASV